MADLKIYNNGENKVLMSAGDRIIRQPYEFGYGFICNDTHRLRVDLSGIPFVELIETYSPHLSPTEYRLVRFMTTSGAWITASIFGNSSNLTGDAYYVGSGFGSDYWSSLVFRNIPTVFTTFDTINKSIKAVGNVSFAGRVLTYLPDHTLSYIETFYGRASGSSILLGNLMGFDRELPIPEKKFYVNNLIYSEIQSTEGLLFKIEPKSKANILDFSLAQDGSSMGVGLRDVSGNNRHGRIMNLPAGTLQEQLAFANANLFVPFIQ